MGFLSSVLGIFKSQEERERDKIFGKIDKILNDDRTQIMGLQPVLQDMLDDARMDMLPNATGAFGRDPGNPILCNGPLGEITYLSRLCVKTNKTITPITFHRIGTTSSPNTHHEIDVYETIDYTGIAYDVLYFDFYHTTKSKKCPEGYILEEQCLGFRGINQLNTNFPHDQYELTIKYAEKMLGVAIFDTDMKNMDVEQAERTIRFVKKNHAKMTWW